MSLVLADIVEKVEVEMTTIFRSA